jgi:glycosyltransferase involved in cell wall biosynthesis
MNHLTDTGAQNAPLDEAGIECSLIIPVYRNEKNLPDLLTAIEKIRQQTGERFEAVFVVDGSPDRSAEVLMEALPGANFDSQLMCLSRNFGAFSAARVGLEAARGQFVAVMAADLQEPPELIHAFFERLRSDAADVIFGKRIKRNDGWLADLASNFYWKAYQKFILKDIPDGGVDIFACNRKVRDSVLQIEEPNSSLVAQLFWVGFRRDFVPYERQERVVGKSSWTFQKKLRYMLDSIFSYSDLPIMLIFWLGLTGVLTSLLVGTIVFLGWLAGTIDVKGYTPLMLTVSFIGCSLLMSQGLMGCYLWRAFENSKHRPLALIGSKMKFGAKPQQ